MEETENKVRNKWLKNGSELTPLTSPITVFDLLPSQHYLLQWHPEKGYYITEMDSPRVVDKLYGEWNREEVKRQYTVLTKMNGGGILFVGKKGMGKTEAANYVCSISGRAVLHIASSFHGPSLMAFLNNFRQPFIIMVDEYEKIYKNEDREAFLSIMDGNKNQDIVFLLTSNTYQISDYLKGRTGRIRYCLDFNNLDSEQILEFSRDFLSKYLEEGLLTEEVMNKLFSFVLKQGLINDLNYDTLQAILKEAFYCNFDLEILPRCVKALNIGSDTEKFWSVGVSYNGIPLSNQYARKGEHSNYYNGDTKNMTSIRIYPPNKDVWDALLPFAKYVDWTIKKVETEELDSDGDAIMKDQEYFLANSSNLVFAVGIDRDVSTFIRACLVKRNSDGTETKVPNGFVDFTPYTVKTEGYNIGF